MMTVKAVTLVIFAALSISASASIPQDSVPPERYLALSDEALAAARYSRATEISRAFLDRFVNTNTCTGAQLVHHLTNIRRAYEALGRNEEYNRYCQQLFDSIDPLRTGTLVRAFITIALDAKGDAASTSIRRHSFTHFNEENANARSFYERNICTVLKNLPSGRPLVEAWLHLVHADLLCFDREFESADVAVSRADSVIAAHLPGCEQGKLLIGMAREIFAAQTHQWQQAADLASSNLQLANRLSSTSKEAHALKSRLLQYYLYLQQPYKAINQIGDEVVRSSVFDAAPEIIDYSALQGFDIPNSPADLFAGRDIYLDRLNAAEALFAADRKQKGSHYAAKVLFNLQKDIASNYAAFAFNRADASLKAKVDMLVEAAPAYAVKYNADTLLQQLAYNAAMMHKQLSLSSGNLFREAALIMDNEAISRRYDELANTKKLLEKSAANQADSLLKRISVLEAYLQRNLTSRVKVSPASLPDWKDVRNALEPGEAAVEFMIAPDGQSNIYIASILCPDSEYPLTVSLCPVDEINSTTDLFGSTAFYNSFWQPVINNLPGIKRIHFAPVGMLNLLPIEYTTVDGSTMLNEMYSLNRLTTTRRLCYRRPTTCADAITLYGGIKYALDSSDPAPTTTEDTFKDTVSFDSETAANMRAGIEYLPATLDEVHDIAGMFSDKPKEARIIEGAEATELSFKQLDGMDMPMLHLATHGFALPNRSRSRLGRLLSARDKLSTFEERSLGRSGLMMAGAANSVNSKDRTALETGNDGLLTAREISRLNLSGVKMAVLSACESGLGELNTEGVSGLQRGLKRAGVQTMVMSLWKVDDVATSLLMKYFYSNILAGQQPADALRMAQRSIREADGNRFDKPLYWAAFIVVDAL